jgi:hypothetical protein
MTKRSRYQNVSIINGKICIYALGQIYTFDSIDEWDKFEYTNAANPNETRYMLIVVSNAQDTTIACSDKDELNAIESELIDQGV